MTRVAYNRSFDYFLPRIANWPTGFCGCNCYGVFTSAVYTTCSHCRRLQLANAATISCSIALVKLPNGCYSPGLRFMYYEIRRYEIAVSFAPHRSAPSLNTCTFVERAVHAHISLFIVVHYHMPTYYLPYCSDSN